MKQAELHNAFHTPILLNVFNRPEETSRVLAELAEQQVPILYVHCDGVREGREDDVHNVAQVQQLIKETVTWPCELHTMYEEKNYGCGESPFRAMTWFFEHVEEGIILEDDCVPHPDFFMYCQELLERYRDNDQIAVIGGTNRHQEKNRGKYSYYFSPYMETWGWATWRRVWQLYDYNFDVPDSDFRRKVWPLLKSWGATNYWLRLLQQLRKDTAAGKKTYWDYQLDLMCLYRHKIHILPRVNMISNIGFNDRATHTFGSAHANATVHAILPLYHPDNIRVDYSDYKEYSTILRAVKQVIKRIIHFK